MRHSAFVWKDAMVHEGTRSVAAGRISFIPWEQSALHWKDKIVYPCCVPKPCLLLFLHSTSLGLTRIAETPQPEARSKHHTGFVLILVSNPVSATYYLLYYLWPCCVSYFTSVICACLKWACQHTVEVNVSKNTGPTDLFNMMSANKTHSKACCSCMLSSLVGNSLMKGRTHLGECSWDHNLWKEGEGEPEEEVG